MLELKGRRTLTNSMIMFLAKFQKQTSVSNITKPEPYHSAIESFPTVIEFVSTLTAQELAKGVSAITTLGDKAELGFTNLGVSLTR